MKNETFPKVSIVIPTRNQGRYIEQAIASVVGQQYPHIELIIIDGGSTDDTVEIIERYSDRVSYWISEPDDGPAAAINKGFRKATGEVLGWLNSDDFYLPQILPDVVRLLGNPENPALVYGGCLFYDETASPEPLLCDAGPVVQGTRNYIPPDFDRELLSYHDFVAQPSAFWTTALWKSVGDIDESIYTAFDWDWFIRAAMVCDFVPLKKPLSTFRLHDRNITRTAGLRRSREIVQIVEKYAPSEWGVIHREIYGHMAFLAANSEAPLKRLNGSLLNIREILPEDMFEKYGEPRVVQAVSNLYVPPAPGSP